MAKPGPAIPLILASVYPSEAKARAAETEGAVPTPLLATAENARPLAIAGLADARQLIASIGLAEAAQALRDT